MLELTLSHGRGYGKLRLQRVVFCMDNDMGKNPCDNLINRGFTLIGWCWMCQCGGETVNHLLIHCEVAYALWGPLFRNFGIQWVIPRWVIDLLFGQRRVIKPDMFNGTKYCVIKNKHIHKISVAALRMLGLISGKTWKYRIKNEEIHLRIGAPINEKIRKSRSR